MVLAEEHRHTMVLDQAALLKVLDAPKTGGIGSGRRLRRSIRPLIEAELSAVIGAEPHQRTEARTAQRNGHRPRTVSTAAGELELKIPKLQAGSFFPSLVERGRRVDQSLFTVIMEAVHGTSTRNVDDLVRDLGADTGIRGVADLRRPRRQCRRVPDRSLRDQTFRTCSRRHLLQGLHRIVSKAVVVATSVAAHGHREVLSGSTSGTARTARSGPRSCARCGPAMRGTSGHLRRPRRPAGGHHLRPARRLLAKMQTQAPWPDRVG